jgi:hypothetical protein
MALLIQSNEPFVVSLMALYEAAEELSSYAS